MSRCFPYPPPAYVKNGIRDEALIESIKKELEKAKKEKRRERKREKKERERTRKGEVEIKKHHKKRNRDDRSQIDQHRDDKEKITRTEVGILERSGLTEEHGQPVGSQISTDSTYYSNKMQKENLPVDEGGNNPGSIIRIKLPAQRHKDPEVLPGKEQPCSSSFAGIIGEELSFRPVNRKSCPTSVAELRVLLENLLPPLVPELCTVPDMEWLFETKQRKNHAIERCSSAQQKIPRLETSNPWPCAQFLPEADIYALPYVIPF